MADHDTHDQLLVAAFAAGDAEGDDVVRATALVESCRDCAELAADLRSIARATAALPAPRRPREFALSSQDAERLRPRGLRRLAAAIERPRILVLRPLGGGLVMVGITGLLLAALPGVTLQGAAQPAAGDAQRLELAASPTPQADVQGGAPAASAPAASAPAPAPSGGTLSGFDASAKPTPSPPPRAAAATGAPATATPAAPILERDGARTGPSPLVIGSAALVVVGGLLFVLPGLRPGRRRT